MMRFFAVVVAVVVAAASARADTHLFVNGAYCGALADLTWNGRALGALDCTTTIEAEPGKPREAMRALRIGEKQVGWVCDLVRPTERLEEMRCEPLPRVAPMVSPTAAPVETPTPKVTATPAPVPTFWVPKCPSFCPAGSRCDPVACDAFGQCSCVAVAPTATPTPKPTPTRTPVPGATAVRSGSISGIWWPATVARGEETFAGWPGSWRDQASSNGWYCVPDQISDAVLVPELDRAASLGRKPTCFLAEATSFGWCMDVARAGGFRTKRVVGSRIVWTDKPLTQLPDTLTSGGTTVDALKARLSLLTSKGFTPDRVVLAPYTFGWRTTLSSADLSMLQSKLPEVYGSPRSPWPAGGKHYGWPGTTHDLPDAVTVEADARCFDRWLGALRVQHPEIGRVVVQGSNCGRAYGFQGLGFDVYPKLAAALRAHGYPAEVQIEACNVETTPPGAEWSKTPAVDCPALKTALTGGTSVSVFSGELYDPMRSGWEACR